MHCMPAGHAAHDEPVHCSVAAQWLPHAPQLFEFHRRLTQESSAPPTPWQTVLPLVQHEPHIPPTQVSPVLQAWPHAPRAQCHMSLRRCRISGRRCRTHGPACGEDQKGERSDQEARTGNESTRSTKGLPLRITSSPGFVCTSEPVATKSSHSKLRCLVRSSGCSSYAASELATKRVA